MFWLQRCSFVVTIDSLNMYNELYCMRNGKYHLLLVARTSIYLRLMVLEMPIKPNERITLIQSCVC